MEFCAAAAVVEHLLRITTVLAFFCLETQVKIKLDSSAAKVIDNREGGGRVRSLETRVWWLQQAVRQGLIQLVMVSSDVTLADLGTKTLRVDRLEKLRNGCGIALNMAGVLESEDAVRRLDKACFERLLRSCGTFLANHGKWLGAVAGTVAHGFS